jgi:hypothetical protein
MNERILRVNFGAFVGHRILCQIVFFVKLDTIHYCKNSLLFSTWSGDRRVQEFMTCSTGLQVINMTSKRKKTEQTKTHELQAF